MIESMMVALMVASYGSWVSPIDAELIGKGAVSFYDMQVEGNQLYWNELHPSEQGRVALIRQGKDLAPQVSVRTRVHEYGGGAFVVHKGVVFFTNDKDRLFYRLDPDGKMTRLSSDPRFRFADACVTSDGKSLILVCEEHQDNGQVLNYLAKMDAHSEKPLQVVASGHDFYSSPRLSPDGKQLAFLTWDFPNMPWDGTTLWTLDLKSQVHTSIAGGSEESICQIAWSPQGELHFVSDRTGFWNLYRQHRGKVENLYKMDAEFGLPAWVFGRPTYAFISYEGHPAIVCSYTEKGIDRLGLLFPEEKQLKDLQLPFTGVFNVCASQGKVYFFGASPTECLSIIAFDPATRKIEVVKAAFPTELGKEWFSVPELIEYPSLNGKRGYGLYYPPKNPRFKAPSGEKPPMIVRCHGGPNGRSYAYLSMEVQYWTSRGFAFLDVNYGGSTGFGREYLKRLEGEWGVIDVYDAISAAKTMALKGLADEKRLFIRGGSAGGYTVLCALTRGSIFAGGTSYFGVSDLELLASDTHKFESRYNDRLVGPPEATQLLRERSPIYYVDQIVSPVLLLQGEDDKIVPPNQAEKIYQVLNERGIKVEYILFPGEGHGFRKAENIKRSLETELEFYKAILKQ